MLHELSETKAEDPRVSGQPSLVLDVSDAIDGLQSRRVESPRKEVVRHDELEGVESNYIGVDFAMGLPFPHQI